MYNAKLLLVLVALLLCALLPLGALAEVADAPAAAPLTAQTVLATVNGREVTYGEVSKYYTSLLSQYSSMMDLSQPDVVNMLKEAAISYTVAERVIQLKAEELGLDQFTEEELQTMQQNADDAYQSAFDQCRPQFQVEGMSEEDLAKNVDAYLGSMGYTRDGLLDQLKNNQLYLRVMATVSGNVEVSDEQLQTLFDQKVQEAKAAYEADKGKFDTDSMSGAAVYYVPEGVRAVKHILVMMDMTEAAQIKAYRDELNALPEGDAGRAELQQKITDAMAVVQPKLDEIRAKIDAGEDFQSLIDAYGEDPGMQPGSPYRDSGYTLSESTVVFEMPFTQAALALSQVGDVSEPTLASRGFHIIRYERDVPSGAVAFDGVKEQLRASELSVATQKAESEAVSQWTQDADVQIFLDRFA